MEAKEFLNQLEKIDFMIENKFIEIDQWRNIAEGLSSGGKTVNINGVLHNMDKVQTSRNPNKMSDAVIKIFEIIEEIEMHIDKLKDTKKEVTSLIERLNPIEYDFLHKVYVQHLTLSEVAGIYRNSYSWATTTHSIALKNAQILIDEKEKKGEIKCQM